MKVTDSSPAPKNRSEQRQSGRLVAAFLCGCFVTIGTLGVYYSLLHVPGVREFVVLVLSLLAGGFVSGVILEPDLDTRRWRLMWLLFASPAILVWCAALFFAICDLKESSSDLPLLVAFCFPPAAGSVVGYYAAHGWRLRRQRKKEDPPLPRRAGGITS